MYFSLGWGEEEVERDWDREGEARGCEFVCVCGCEDVCVRVWWLQGRRSDRVRYVMHY